VLLADLVAVARGDSPASLILANAKIVNTLTAEIDFGNVAIFQGRVAGVGDYTQGEEVVDLGGRYLAPAFIDGHTHLESSMLHPAQYARAVVPRGTLGVVTDLHEMANVAGVRGIRYILDWGRRLPLDFYFMAPPCVPATTTLETPGAILDIDDFGRLLRWPETVGMGEVMNFPGVVSGEEGMLRKVALAQGRVRDGHAPGLAGKALNAYIAAGILSDHESTSADEGLEKLRRGMHLMIREGSSEKNLEALLPLVTDDTYHRCFFVVDDRSCADLLRDGDMDVIVRRAIKGGLKPVRALQLATINTARYFRLEAVGAVAPGYYANLLVLSDLTSLDIDLVFYRGHLVARGGKPLFPVPPARGGPLSRSLKVKPFGLEALGLPAPPGECPVIQLVPGQIITRKVFATPKVVDGWVVSDTEADLLKLVVVERHHATGNIGRGLVRGFGLGRGALASSIAHDTHNIVAVGVEDRDIKLAIDELVRLQGGLVAVDGGKILAHLPLPMGGLLSPAPLEEVAAGVAELERVASENLGCRLPAPFAALSFLALPVIPELRLTDLGVVDVIEGRILDW